MKKLILIACSIIVASGISVAQTSDGLKLHPCGTYEAMEAAFKADPNLKLKYNLIQSQLDLEYQAALKEKEETYKKMSSATVYTIPVVFHVMGPQNIPDQVFVNCIEQVNKDYSRNGSDTGTININFKPLYIDAEIQFALAKKDPNGKCTNGIIRHDERSVYWNQNSPNYAYSGTGTNRWPREKYLNVYIVECISSTQISCPPTSGLRLGGYTYLPGSAPGSSADAIVMIAAELGQNQITDARTLSHEIGHWLNLQHTFGGSNNPGQTCGDDGVTDTPITTGVQSQCPSSEANSCAGSGNLWNVENIMDYSSCAKMFTSGQATRMRTALASATAGRSNLWSAANMIATGLSGSYTCAPVADLKANRRIICQDNTIIYTNLSQVGTSGSIEWVFEGGVPATSTASAPVVTYANPGTYSVSITATNPDGTNTMNKTAFINVVNGGGGYQAPTLQDFEGASLPNDFTVINNNNNVATWQLTSASGGNSTSKSIYLNNASATSNTGGHIDIFETPFYNLSNTTSASISYYYSYAKKTAAQKDTFKLQYSIDCGGTWTNILGVPNLNTMANNTGGTLTDAFVPTSTQWVQTIINPALLSLINNKPAVKFRFWFKSDVSTGSSNNIYIDQINLSGTVGINELENAIGLNLYPNPTSSSSQLEFNLQANQKATIKVYDMVGGIMEQANVSGSTIIYTINQNGQLSSGVYMVTLEVNNQSITKKLIIE